LSLAEEETFVLSDHWQVDSTPGVVAIFDFAGLRFEFAPWSLVPKRQDDTWEPCNAVVALEAPLC
jgi:hypothetical protein